MPKFIKCPQCQQIGQYQSEFLHKKVVCLCGHQFKIINYQEATENQKPIEYETKIFQTSPIKEKSNVVDIGDRLIIKPDEKNPNILTITTLAGHHIGQLDHETNLSLAPRLRENQIQIEGKLSQSKLALGPDKEMIYDLYVNLSIQSLSPTPKKLFSLTNHSHSSKPSDEKKNKTIKLKREDLTYRYEELLIHAKTSQLTNEECQELILACISTFSESEMTTALSIIETYPLDHQWWYSLLQKLISYKENHLIINCFKLYDSKYKGHFKPQERWGNYYLNTGNHQTAIESYLKCIQILTEFSLLKKEKATHIKALEGLTHAHLQINQSELSLHYCLEIFQLDSSIPENLKQIGSLYSQQNNTFKAIEFLSRAIAEKPKYMEALSLRALNYEREKEYKKAITDLELILTIKPRDKEIKKRLDRLNSYFDINSKNYQPSEMPIEFEEVVYTEDDINRLKIKLRRHPKDPEINYQYAKALQSIKKHKEAIPYLTAAIENESHLDYIIYLTCERADCYLLIDKYYEAITDYQFCANQSNEPKVQAFAYANIAETKCHLSDFSGAAEDLKKAIVYEQEGLLINTFKAKLGQCLMYSEKEEEALAVFLDALKSTTNPADKANIHNWIAGCYNHLEELQKSIEHIKEAIQLDPSVSQYNFNLCDALLEINELEKAMDLSTQGIQQTTDPIDAAEYYAYRATTKCKQNNNLDGLQDIISAIELNGSKMEYVLTRANIHFYLGNKQEAKEDCLRVLEKNKKNLKALDLLKEIEKES